MYSYPFHPQGAGLGVWTPPPCLHSIPGCVFRSCPAPLCVEFSAWLSCTDMWSAMCCAHLNMKMQLRQRVSCTTLHTYNCLYIHGVCIKLCHLYTQKYPPTCHHSGVITFIDSSTCAFMVGVFQLWWRGSKSEHRHPLAWNTTDHVIVWSHDWIYTLHYHHPWASSSPPVTP